MPGLVVTVPSPPAVLVVSVYVGGTTAVAGAKAASECARRLADPAQPSVVLPATATVLVLLPPLPLPAEDCVHARFCPAFAVRAATLLSSTTSTTTALLVSVVIWLLMRSAPLVSLCAKTASAGPWLTPKNEIAPAWKPPILPARFTCTVYVPAGGSSASVR